MSDYSAALTFCNDVRRGLHRQPIYSLRKGYTSDPSRCVVANTINFGARNRVDVDSHAVELDGEVIAKVPAPVGQFIIDFDGDRMPELVGSGWAE